MRPGPHDAFVDQPGVELVVGLEPQPRRKEAFAHEADLVLDLTLFPARSRRAGDRLDEVMRAHLEEAAIVLTVLAHEDRKFLLDLTDGMGWPYLVMGQRVDLRR